MRPSSDAGLTLVEMLVTLAIVAVMSGIAVLSLGAVNRTATVQVEAQRLAGRLRLAADEVLVTHRVLAFTSDGDSYRFVTRDTRTGEWKPDAVGLLGELHKAPGAMQYTRLDTAPAVIAPDGLSPPLRVTVTGPMAEWTVDFDGLNVTAAPRAKL